MAEKVFALNTTPHVAVVGEDRYEFLPEVVGADFADAYGKLKLMQDKVRTVKAGKGPKDKGGGALDPKVLSELSRTMNDFIEGFMLDESQARWRAARLPDRILVQMIEWVAELYGGGQGNGQAGPSTD